jgi:outer membrane protein OmpA-like peptidoglycan-associated protein
MHLESKVTSEDHWISVSDLMAGLMMIFLFIAISYMIKVKEIATTYTRIQKQLYYDLQQEFKADLPIWKASIDSETLAIRFVEPKILFKKGRHEINSTFKKILDDFFPRYINILKNEKYKNEISAIRIEGHTSSPGLKNQTKDEAYFYNMKLSQDRTRSVLQYVLMLSTIKVDKNWIKNTLTANGLSSSKLILNKNNRENYILSRRVEFRVKINAEKRIRKIAEKQY